MSRPHRTQAQRSEETRLRVCEATLDALVEVGNERISTTLVAERAEVSRGALTHQFPTRNDLLLAAFQHLLDGWRDGSPFGIDPDTRQISVDELIDLLWDQVFSQARYLAATELMLAARQDNDLGRTLRERLVEWIRVRDVRTVRIVGGDPDDAEALLKIKLHLAVLRGIAIHQSFETDGTTARELIELWKRMAG